MLERHLVARDLTERARERIGIPREERARSVCEKLSFARNSAQDELGDNGCEYGENDTGNQKEKTCAIVAIATTAKVRCTQKHIGHNSDKANKYNNHCSQKYVAIANVRELVRNDPLELGLAQNFQKPRRHRDRRMLLVAPRCKRIGDGSSMT